MHTDDDARLAELADDAGISKSKLASALLEELLPTVQGVKSRLQITRKPATPAR